MKMVKFTKNRIEEIIKKDFLKNKTILEVGCVGIGEDDKINGENFLHKHLKKVAKKLVGIDINKKKVEEFNKKGYEVYVKDVEKTFDLKQKFDIIIVAKVLEHLQNLRIFFENIKRHLKKNGLLLILTPNAHSISFFLKFLIKGKTEISETHTHWHDNQTLKNLLKINNFEIIHESYSHPRPIFNKLKGYLIQSLWIFLPKRMGRQILIIARTKNE